MNNYVNRAQKFFDIKNKSDEYKLRVDDVNENILFNFGRNSIGSNVAEQVNKLSELFTDEIPTDFIVIATDAGGNILVTNTINEHIYYYDYNYNFTHLDETMPEPDDFDVMNAYNSYLVANTFDKLFELLTDENNL